MAEELVVRYCAPTLAGIKTGGLFVCPFPEARELRGWLRNMNLLLRSRGLRVLSLHYRRGKALIYVYRPRMLSRDLRNDEARRILHERGYSSDSPGQALVLLTQRLCSGGEFPHEIGLFLGYPPEDVLGFIRDDRPCKCIGCWKVYGDVESAQSAFAAFKNCTETYCSLFAEGCPLEELAVAG